MHPGKNMWMTLCIIIDISIVQMLRAGSCELPINHALGNVDSVLFFSHLHHRIFRAFDATRLRLQFYIQNSCFQFFLSHMYIKMQ